MRILQVDKSLGVMQAVFIVLFTATNSFSGRDACHPWAPEKLSGSQIDLTLPSKETRHVWHLGIDLHRHTVVIAAVSDTGQAFEPVTHACRESETILETVRRLKPFRAVIEATATYRWLYEFLSEHGTVLLAHPAKLRLMTQQRAKTDKLDCQCQRSGTALKSWEAGRCRPPITPPATSPPPRSRWIYFRKRRRSTQFH